MKDSKNLDLEDPYQPAPDTKNIKEDSPAKNFSKESAKSKKKQEEFEQDFNPEPEQINNEDMYLGGEKDDKSKAKKADPKKDVKKEVKKEVPKKEKVSLPPKNDGGPDAKSE